MEEEDPLIAQCRGRVGSMISGKWRLDALIGVGGMAAVYMATHRNGSVGAIKILHEEVALNEEVRERFLREAYIANKVGHPGTVKVLDDDVDDDNTPYLVMELLQGDSVEGLADKNGGRLSVQETLDVIDQTLAVLEAAHAHQIVHRDLKPENLFQTHDGTIKVLDFGIARLREENARKTQTGMVMGTPSFMAPEQAMGRWNEVDHRTDLYAVGATAFTLLTGLPVHEAETAGEMLVAAATRPARSLARVLNNAPFNLVAMVDRALSYERDNRYPDAATMRADLAALRKTLDGKDLTKTQVNPEAVVLPPTVHGEMSPDGYDKGERGERVETYDPSTNTPEEIERMRTFFTLLERALVARKQYSEDHPEPARRLEEAFKELASALMTCDICLAWNFTPYAFVAGEEIIWEPEPPWNRIPYQLFSDGVRTMGLVPGLDEHEFYRWLEVITLDPTRDLAPEDDLVTTLWDANFDYVFHQAIDSFAEGNQEERQRFEAERAGVIGIAHGDAERDVAQAWREGAAEGGVQAHANASGKTKKVLDFVNQGEEIDAETAARVANLNLQDASPEEAKAAHALMIDDSTRALLAARLDLDVGATSERFVVAAAEAFVASAKMGRSAAVTAPLRRAVDGLSAGEPEKAMDMIIELRDTVKVEGQELETRNLRDTITAEILSPATLTDILKGSNKLDEAGRQEYLKGLSKVLECIQGQHFEAAIEFLPDAPEGKVRRLLMEFLQRAGPGHEHKIGALFGDADVELGLELVRLLVSIDSPEAKEAVAMASDSPHALVRIEALGHLEGVSGIRLRTELRKLLEDDQMEVRLAALQAMESHDIAVAGPFLVLRIQDRAFMKLPEQERRQSLQTLCALRPKRGEEVCIELLKEAKLFRSGALESTQQLACHFLAEVAATDGAFYMLDSVARAKGWQYSKAVRDAAAAGLDRLTQRAQEAADKAATAPSDDQPRRRRKKRRTQATRAPELAPDGSHAEGPRAGRPGTKMGAKKKRRTRPNDAGDDPAATQAAGAPAKKKRRKRPTDATMAEGGDPNAARKKRKLKKTAAGNASATATGSQRPPPAAGGQR